MIVKEPPFWYNSPLPWWRYALYPLTFFFLLGGRLRHILRKSRRIPCPVICVGNLTVGGTGKTPTALKIAAFFQKKGKNVHFVTRGYGGALRGPLCIDPQTHTVEEVGDEALLLAEKAPTWVAKNRFRGAYAAYQAGATLIILDDGLQNPSITKTLSLLVVDGTRGFGNGALLPLGPLREPLQEGLKKVQAVLCVGTPQALSLQKIPSSLPHFKAHLTPSLPSLKKLSRDAYVAFCGIGFPQKFFNLLDEFYIPLKGKYAFPDHYIYTSKDLERLKRTARQQQARLLTTHKDWVRLPKEIRSQVDIFEVTLAIDQEESFNTFLERACFP